MLSLFSHVWLFVTPWTVACKASLSMRFPRQENWSGFPFPSPGDLPNPGMEPGSPTLQADSLPSEPLGKIFKWTKRQKTIPRNKEEYLRITNHSEHVTGLNLHRKTRRRRTQVPCLSYARHWLGAFQVYGGDPHNKPVWWVSSWQEGERSDFGGWRDVWILTLLFTKDDVNLSP